MGPLCQFSNCHMKHYVTLSVVTLSRRTVFCNFGRVIGAPWKTPQSIPWQLLRSWCGSALRGPPPKRLGCPSAQLWGRRPGWPCKTISWWVWRTTRNWPGYGQILPWFNEIVWHEWYIDLNFMFASPWKEITALLHPRGYRKPEAMQDIGEGSISILSVLRIIPSYLRFRFRHNKIEQL